MYKSSYAQTMDEFGNDPRQDEREALGIVISQLELAREKGVRSREAAEAIFNARRVWTFLLESLSENSNDLPVEIRADLISIGIWVLKELERLRRYETESFDAIIEINGIIRDSLRG
ncbi:MULTISPECIES: flagellar biosynthesis regulator FlaF [unclassified Pannonibacter]|uniref:flagellar biosynthesis regulator FlaF n=1 Tax=unclassified Pannonibacter TaxID=2627228 RepID=UPI0016459AFA|nr:MULTISPECIES: flagellar biosynthesis regulator FlaF [unclassified Pannonibacter]